MAEAEVVPLRTEANVAQRDEQVWDAAAEAHAARAGKAEVGPNKRKEKRGRIHDLGSVVTRPTS
jgi:hypothetical protein